MNKKAFLGLLTPARLWVMLVVLTIGLLVNTLAHAGEIIVSNNHDNGAGSLRQAIAGASFGDEITFDAGLSGQTITLTTGVLVIVKDLTITGPGADNLTISGNNSSSVFQIDRGNVILSGLMIANGSAYFGGGIVNGGNLTIINSTFSENTAFLDGGGIFNFADRELTISSSIFSGNRATLGDGGGISNDGELTISYSTFSENIANSEGGGISNDDKLTISKSTFSENMADFGGGIFNFDLARLTIRNSSFSGNTAEDAKGGGIYNDGKLMLSHSTFSENMADIEGGGIYNDGELMLSHSTFSENMAEDGGGGIFNDGELMLSHSTLSRNMAEEGGGILNFNKGELTIKNSIVANSPGGGNCSFKSIQSVSGNNFSTDSTCTGFTQVTSADLKLGPLQNNGGSTETHALLPGSVVIGAITDSSFTNGTTPGATKMSQNISVFSASIFVP